jgi:hypothetical protein
MTVGGVNTMSKIQQITPPQPKPNVEQQCKHDWQYDFKKHIHACSKCGTPAPPDWNEVDF